MAGARNPRMATPSSAAARSGFHRRTPGHTFALPHHTLKYDLAIPRFGTRNSHPHRKKHKLDALQLQRNLQNLETELTSFRC